jgi:dihydrofolate reductase
VQRYTSEAQYIACRMVGIVIACGVNGEFAHEGGLPWAKMGIADAVRKRDMAIFTKYTTGKTIIMGRNTYNSIGKPLRNRISVVISRGKVEGVLTYETLGEALTNHPSAIVIGGAKILSTLFANFASEIEWLRVNILRTESPSESVEYIPIYQYIRQLLDIGHIIEEVSNDGDLSELIIASGYALRANAVAVSNALQKPK